jgi:BatD DUF11 like domain
MPIVIFGQQEVRVELSKKLITTNENFSIKVTIRNSEKWEVKDFPTIQGFTKGGISTTHSVDKQKITTHSVSQNYAVSKEGSFKILPFSIFVNGEEVKANGESIIVTTPKDESGIEGENDVLNAKNINTKSNAFLALSVDKDKVFVGEGVKVTIGFYVSKNNTVEMKFPNDLELQLGAMSKKIQSSDCLEERLLITDLKKTDTELNGKKYDLWKIFEAIYYPLNDKPISFPPLTLKMTRIKNNEANESLPYISNSLIIKALNLPEHPLKNKVVVGNFNLFEKIDSKNIETGKSFSYTFRVAGEGNFSTVSLPSIVNDSYFDFYPPTIRTNKTIGKINGEKVFTYQIVPKEAGEKSLDKYFYWVFFNTKKNSYDTLKSKQKIHVLEGDLVTKTSSNSRDLYDGIDKLSTANIETDYRDVTKNITNFLIITMFIGTFFLFDYRRRKK